MPATLLREKTPEIEAFYFEGVEQDGAEIEEWLGDQFISLVPSKNQVIFRNRAVDAERTVSAGSVLFRYGPDWICEEDKDDVAEDFEAVTV